MVKKLSKNKVGRPKKIVNVTNIAKLEYTKVCYDVLSIPLKIAFVFSWAMIAVLVILTIRSFM